MKTSGSRLVASLIALVAVVSAVFIYAFKSTPTPSSNATGANTTTNIPVQTPVTQTEQATIPESTATVSTTSKYKNGTYKATGTYGTPEGQESIDVSLTLENGIVTDANVIANASGGRSLRYQQMFIGGYKTSVVGKNIDELNLGRISGSSLTPIGFNNAITAIKTEAKA